MIASRGTVYALKLAPILFLSIAAAAWFNEVQSGGPWVLRNIAPLGTLVALAALTLFRGKGRWVTGCLSGRWVSRFRRSACRLIFTTPIPST